MGTLRPRGEAGTSVLRAEVLTTKYEVPLLVLDRAGHSYLRSIIPLERGSRLPQPTPLGWLLRVQQAGLFD
jgi:hypothetical protein